MALAKRPNSGVFHYGKDNFPLQLIGNSDTTEFYIGPKIPIDVESAEIFRSRNGQVVASSTTDTWSVQHEYLVNVCSREVDMPRISILPVGCIG